MNLRKPGSIALSCWKLLIFPETMDKVRLIINWLKDNYEKHNLHGKYGASYKENAIAIIVLYFSSKDVMWEFREFLINEWIKLKILPFKKKYKDTVYYSYYIPYQRGCEAYERIFGDWRTWIPEYYSNSLMRKLSKVKIECPLCGSYLVYRKTDKGEFYGCPSYPNCNFMVPKLYVYEVLSDGYAEYELYTKNLMGSIVTLRLEGDIIKAELKHQNKLKDED